MAKQGGCAGSRAGRLGSKAGWVVGSRPLAAAAAGLTAAELGGFVFDVIVGGGGGGGGNAANRVTRSMAAATCLVGRNTGQSVRQIAGGDSTEQAGGGEKRDFAATRSHEVREVREAGQARHRRY